MLDVKEKVVLCGLAQKIHILTDDPDKPVLLFLHGGPGVPNRDSLMKQHSDLTDAFTLVGWDQRGTGGSYWGARRNTLNVAQLVADAEELVRYLCTRFNKEKLFVIGGSWGSMLGTLLANRHPEHIAAYVGYGQLVNGPRNEAISFNFTLEEARKAGDGKTVKKLLSVGPPTNGAYRGGIRGLMTQRNAMMKYGGFSPDEQKRGYGAMIKEMIGSGEYSFTDVLGMLLGAMRTLSAMFPEVITVDFESTCTRFETPVFIFDGMLDKNTPAEIVTGWFDMIDAPHKELIWLEHSGHDPMGDEPERFKRLLREKLIPLKGGSAL